jgi:molecular chaperone DnaJ
MADYYNILEVEKTATQDQIKQSYKRLAKINHPDKGGDKEVFQKIQTAYETLSDEQKRKEYDNPNPFHNMFSGGFPGGFPGGGGHPFDLNNLDFLFKNRQKNKVDTNYTLKITLNDVYFGLKKHFNIKHDVKCDSCNKKCDRCKGVGKVKQMFNMGMMQIVQEQPCTNCNGYGIIKDGNNCVACESKGFNVRETKIEVIVPPGVENNTQISFKGLGEQPKTENEIAGDFIVLIKIDEGVLFKRDKLDLIYDTRITFKDSVVGKKLVIPHFDKEFEVSTRDFGVINPTKKYVVYNKGLKNQRGDTGNLCIKFNIDYEGQILSDDQIEKLKEIL